MNVGFFIFPGFQLLDLSGPLAAFEIAQRFEGASHYRFHYVSLEGGLVASSNGVRMESHKLGTVSYDTLVVIGGDTMDEVCRCARTRKALLKASHGARRVASICTGAYLLAETGLLAGRRATTHWKYAADFQRKYPQIRVEPDRIYMHDGRFWTSAGITAGIDLALALIEEDCGEETAHKVAQSLVVFYRRPGGQSQYSALLQAKAHSERIGNALGYARQNLTSSLSIEELAEAVNLSPRQFARVFKEETGQTPAKAIEHLRLEAARIRIEENPSESLEEIAATTGFNSLERMRRSFIRAYGQAPQSLRRVANARKRDDMG